MSQPGRLKSEVERRRTFAIISHPDAGKTTLTEKLLLYGGAIQMAGAVKAKRGRAARSDWMKIEQERGISVSTSVMQFPYGELKMNLLDTPGHADFSEDTYRTLHAVDGALMLLDSAKGVEAQTRKLFRVCKQRQIPIFSFVNKMDRPGRDPLELVDEVENVLSIGVYPITWPIFRSSIFRGVYHRLNKQVYLFDADRAISSAGRGADVAPVQVTGIDDPVVRQELDETGYARLLEDIDLLDSAGDAFDMGGFLAGNVSPMFFGSAVNNFGLTAFLDTFSQLMPPPASRMTDEGETIEATDENFSGFVFKMQANMNKAHRDRVAFVRICSGWMKRDMKVLHVRSGKEVRLSNPSQFFAQERNVVEEAVAGDVVGVFDPGLFEIGDTLTVGAKFEFEKIPSFAPEHFSRLLLVHAMKRKQLQTGMEQLAREGTVQIYRPPGNRAGELILGGVGALQLEVTQYRLLEEYGVEIRYESLPYKYARWVAAPAGVAIDVDELRRVSRAMVVHDVRSRVVILAESELSFRWAQEFYPDYQFTETAVGVVVRKE